MSSTPDLTGDQNSASEVLRRTQWDSQLLPCGVSEALPVSRNTGRQMLVLPDGSTLLALAYGGTAPVLRVWRDGVLQHQYALEGEPSAPCFVPSESGWNLWYSLDGKRVCSVSESGSLVIHEALHGEVEDVVRDGKGVLLLLSRAHELHLCSLHGGELQSAKIDSNARHAVMEREANSALHIAYEKRSGVEYRRYDDLDFERLDASRAERVCEAFCFHPALLAHKGRVLIAFRGEQCRRPSYKKWADAWERLGRGGYIGAAVLDAPDAKWRRFRLADATQSVQRIRMGPSGPYGAGEADLLRARLDEYSPPALCLASDGVPQVLWANRERRYIYQSRFGGEEFADAIEAHGPFEQLHDVLFPKKSASHSLPYCAVTKTRAYFNSIALPSREIGSEHQTDWVQLDELSAWSGVERVLNVMERYEENPVIPAGSPGEYDDAGLVADIHHEDGQWHAETMYLSTTRRQASGILASWEHDGRAASENGIHWKKLPPRPLEKKFVIEGDKASMYSLRYLRDDEEPDAAHRFKGFYRSAEHEPWGWLAITSPDEVHWTPVETPVVVRADDDLRVWRDENDVHARRFKANAISRGHCGRVAAMWTSPDGMHWDGERETLDFFDPWNAPPHLGSTGRILLESWAGPDDEDELHGGYIFRDGARSLLHYMKWTPDGHIYLGLASSRDGINFSRVCGGQSTLPLGEAGAWDAGRVAIREAPFLVDGVWRQYYTGCGWKHGFGGVGAKTSPVCEDGPNQMGFAEIPAGRWTHLQMRRESAWAHIETVLYELKLPCRLALNVEGNAANSALQCGVFDSSGNAIEGFDFDDCDSTDSNGRRVLVCWRGRGLEALGARPVQIKVRWNDLRVKLFGLHFSRVL